MKVELPPPLSVIQIEGIYLEYDEPLLYLASNEYRDRFLVNLVSEDDGGQVWYFVRVSPQRIEAIRSGAIDLKDAYLLAEGAIVWSLHFDQTEGRELKVVPLAAYHLDEDLLPMAGERAKIP